MLLTFTERERPLTSTAVPSIELDPDTLEVRIHGGTVDHEPPTALPMTQRYVLF